MTEVKVVVEGAVDYAVAQRLLIEIGAEAVLAADFRGREPILAKLRGYDIASRYEPWLVLMDLDNDRCAPSLLTNRLPQRSGQIVVRVAVREIEAWLLADPELANALRVPTRVLPNAPDDVPMPKHAVVNMVRAHCRARQIRSDVLPERGAAFGSGYKNLLINFVRENWNPQRAAQRSDSLRRCLTALDRLRLP